MTDSFLRVFAMRESITPCGSTTFASESVPSVSIFLRSIQQHSTTKPDAGIGSTRPHKYPAAQTLAGRCAHCGRLERPDGGRGALTPLRRLNRFTCADGFHARLYPGQIPRPGGEIHV